MKISTKWFSVKTRGIKNMTIKQKSKCLFSCLSELGKSFKSIDFTHVQWNQEKPYRTYLVLNFDNTETRLVIEGKTMDELFTNIVNETDKLLARFVDEPIKPYWNESEKIYE